MHVGGHGEVVLVHDLGGGLRGCLLGGLHGPRRQRTSALRLDALFGVGVGVGVRVRVRVSVPV